MKRMAMSLTLMPVIFMLFVWNVGAQPEYAETIRVLKELYEGERKAYHTYLAYAQKARTENYPYIAHLFITFSASEEIHARNFKNLLAELGVEIKEIAKPTVELQTTKKNLRRACEFELNEIDHFYPACIERIKAENHEAAIRDMVYAWQAEKQHRGLIRKIQSGTGLLFGVLVKVMEKDSSRYFVCQRCGSTLTSLPEHTCPICRGPIFHYREIMGDQ